VTVRVLIIEDNLSNLELMTYLLKASGHEIVQAENGRLGLDAAASGRFDVILCDVHLPDISGEEIAQLMKDIPREARPPLIAVTALAMLGDRERLLAAGFDGYIAKPIEPGSLAHQVEAAVTAGSPAAIKASPHRHKSAGKE